MPSGRKRDANAPNGDQRQLSDDERTFVDRAAARTKGKYAASKAVQAEGKDGAETDIGKETTIT